VGEWRPDILEPGGQPSGDTHAHPILLSYYDLHRNLKEPNIQPKSGKVERLPLQISPEAKIMLAQLGHIAPIGVNAHGHIEFEPTHKHSHAEPKDI